MNLPLLMVRMEPTTTMSTRMMRKAHRKALTAASKAVSVRLGLRRGLRVVFMVAICGPVLSGRWRIRTSRALRAPGSTDVPVS